MYIAMIKLCLNLHVELPFMYADARYLVQISWCVVNLNLEWKDMDHDAEKEDKSRE